MNKNSHFSQKLARNAGIVDLMADLGEALNVNPNILFLGGGNPAGIPAFEQKAAAHLQSIIEKSDVFHKLIGVYQSPQGSEVLIKNLAHYLRDKGWPVTERNICLTNGSQSAFFMMINALTGAQGNGEQHKICLPLVPEYLGYADQPLVERAFYSVKPSIETIGEHRFKYHIDFDALKLDKSVSALCISRPTNPSGNVVAREEMAKLGALADEFGIPLIVDCAYGRPFPGIEYDSESITWQTNRVFVMSLSKLGLPGARTGIVVADEPVIESLTKMNTVMSLASGSFGPYLMNSFLESHELDDLCHKIIVPFYAQKRQLALSLVDTFFEGLNYRVHVSDGAFFLWLWFPDLPIDSKTLYQRLKSKNVLVMDGQHFFFEHQHDWPHAKQCIRISYCAEDTVLEEAIKIIADEVGAL